MSFATSGAVPSHFSLQSRVALALGHATVDAETQKQLTAFGSSLRDETDDYIGSSFPKQLANVTVLLKGFRHYMVQDASYLEHYYRVRTEAVGKSGDFEEINKVAAKLAKSLDWVTFFREDMIDKLGVPKLNVAGEESKALLDSIAPHEEVLKKGDWLDIL
ncbi:hypothetical protein OG21DRAFT_965576 [Imleria badia]|nr:hypothetical protein OG21DRAFT_965576 [Imleria badia]